MRLIAAITSSLNVDLSVPTVFDAPTVGSLSQRLETDAISVQKVAPVQTLKKGTGIPLFRIHPGMGSVWRIMLLIITWTARSLEFNNPEFLVICRPRFFWVR
jgi:hypothetical protein